MNNIKKIGLFSLLFLMFFTVASCKGNEDVNNPNGNNQNQTPSDDTNNSTNNGNSTGTGSSTGSGESSGTGSGTGSGESSGTGSGTGSGESSGTGSSTGSGESSGTGSGTGSGESSGTGSGTGSGENTGTGSGTGSGESSGTGTGTGDNGNWNSSNSSTAIEITEYSGHLESAYVEWKGIPSAASYNVYYKEENASTYIKIDQKLIRLYPNNYRADVVGLKAGKYTLKIVPVSSNSEGDNFATANVTVKAHDRSGYAFVGGTSSGAYNDDGTLKSNANVIYVTEKTKDKVTLTSGTTTYTGLQNIIAAHKKDVSTPLCVRFIGNITDPATLEKGDLLIDGVRGGITLEGIGEDTVINGFGIRIKGSSNVEVRNLATMNCNSEEGDNIGLQQDNDHIWIHNNDFFYGNAGSDKDQAKGDGALDTKKSTYVTHSYNHFWDSGKSNLQGMTSETTSNKITYHHNWYDHSDSRHPRVRTCTVHVYNNYFDGNAKYGVGATMGSSIFVENNYFRNCKNPMLSSNQGTDALGEGTFSGENGGMIKAFGNYIIGGNPVIYYSDSNSSFDAYLASSRDEVVPSSIVTVAGKTAYSNFDTASDFYQYTIDTPEVARENVMKYAGRINGGDFKYVFDNSVEDTNYAVIQDLKNKITNYKTTLVKIFGEEDVDNGTTTPPTDDPGNTGGSTENPGGSSSSIIDGSVVYNVTELENKGNSYFTVNGNMKNDTYNVNYGGYTLTKGLKLESSTSIKFKTDKEMTLTLVLTNPSKKVKIDEVNQIANTNGVLTCVLAAGDHEIKKGDTTELLLIVLS